MRGWPFATGTSQIASAHHVDDEAYLASSRAICETNLLHRKHWEWAFIHATAAHLGLLRSGGSALGFGVGREPLVSAFAAQGMRVLATDQPRERAGNWADTGQHATHVEELLRPDICEPAVFTDSVTYRQVDMTCMPSDLGLHDVVWSSCCFEHLGSPRAGLDFVRESMEFVKPGGAALHTTEYALSRFRPLQEIGDPANGDYVVFYRRREIAALIRRLRRDGFVVKVDWRVSRRHHAERQIDRPPYSHNPHMRLEMADRVVTSVGLCIRRPIRSSD